MPMLLQRIYKVSTVLILVLAFSSCGTMSKTDIKVGRRDMFNRCFSGTALVAKRNWKMGDDILYMRRNGSFRYFSKVLGLMNSGYYAGKYTIKNDTVIFQFDQNYKPAFFSTDTLVFDSDPYDYGYNILRNIHNSTSFMYVHKSKLEF